MTAHLREPVYHLAEARRRRARERAAEMDARTRRLVGQISKFARHYAQDLARLDAQIMRLHARAVSAETRIRELEVHLEATTEALVAAHEEARDARVSLDTERAYGRTMHDAAAQPIWRPRRRRRLMDQAEQARIQREG